ncbi:MAG: RdgB/HAM1 family non-canonical purine NTP pyrophosphatase [Methanomicrobiales archaeon]
MKLFVVTSNPHKADEIRSYFGEGIEVEDVRLECPECRHDDVAEIARYKAEFAWEKLKSPLIVDDTALSIDSLSGFPGPYAAYVFYKIGNEGILRLTEGKPRGAHFETAIAYADSSGIRVFRGVLAGRIVEPRGREGFGYDPIFECNGHTLAEIPLEEKSRISHRALALRELHDWLLVRKNQ